MLRITLPTAGRSELFILEGRLTGLWAKELLRVARGIAPDCGNIFDLQEVFYVDAEGEKALRLLSGRGASFITESAYGKDLCNRLNLRRVGASGADKHTASGSALCRKPRQRQNPAAGTVDECDTADANQRRSSRAR